ncbi:phosphatase PAP2 family protein [Amnibacterium sp. CER49]|uniref:phosphatase PAP2 family protein n=1 Tax=Amnibacterium sp. CER49 TaxID=3039161 RepID=UPI00244C07A4|nr:phosphatase PAP2 family protein [Amnibacterium sp. CER49]MDH2442412.1 phosphatase PAP2 family protein [Amnibacterium sp. CER49]
MSGAGSERPSSGDAAELEEDRFVGRSDLTRWHSRPGALLARLGDRLAARLGDRAALVLILVLGGVAIVALAFALDVVYDSVTERDGVAALDLPVLRAVVHLRSGPLDTFCAVIAEAFGGVGMPIIATASAVLFVAIRRAWTPAILIAATGLGSVVMTTVGKGVVGRHRPPLIDAAPPFESSFSFPSGHTTSTTAIAGVIVYLLILRQHSALARTVTIAVGALVAIIVGLTRVVLGAHWFTDVLAGWFLGTAWLAVVITAHRLYLTAREHRRRARGAAAPEPATGPAPSR